MTKQQKNGQETPAASIERTYFNRHKENPNQKTREQLYREHVHPILHKKLSG
jgi:hypothetical protein